MTEDQMACSLEALLRDPARIRALVKRALALVDGKGLRRVCAVLEA